MAPPGPADPASSGVPGTVASTDYMGMMVRYVVDSAGRQLIVTQAVGEKQYRTGDSVCVRVPADAWMRF